MSASHLSNIFESEYEKIKFCCTSLRYMTLTGYNTRGGRLRLTFSELLHLCTQCPKTPRNIETVPDFENQYPWKILKRNGHSRHPFVSKAHLFNCLHPNSLFTEISSPSPLRPSQHGTHFPSIHPTNTTTPIETPIPQPMPFPLQHTNSHLNPTLAH
jgi:hypothetical protein